METLQGKHAVVTGASRGIGLAIAHALMAQGARITLMARDARALEAAAAELGGDTAWQAVDVTDAEGVAAAFARAGAVDILVNNAGQAASAPFGRTDAALWQRMLDVNLTGAYHCIHAALPGMLDAGWGRVVNVASTAGLTGYRYVAAYCAAKHGLVGLTRALALEVANKGVTVNAVCPGFTDTDIVADAVANIVRKTGRTADQARAELAAANPQGRLLQPDEVAHAVAWLCMPGAAAMNGQAIAVAGGEVM
ncbi:SDR family oxidoreductase [Telluria mixta]|uniref:SDR family oxidoreductase n=1 Tax=Telluria mixta TaxID=34071 RepID=A0ABT2C432_9BURK|nr:SDR family NAD(P)-dependent oxidoreductase [Telluria mixta]MCS0632148.1 SDR family oxidoreductase [Telluria mixta]WEM95179.1 SDR family NAD(P)-dependent oxidoreductase [Telluria mixta]